MSLFDTTGKTAITAARKENILRKLDRMNQPRRHEGPGRVPAIGFVRGGFTGHANSDYQTQQCL